MGDPHQTVDEPPEGFRLSGATRLVLQRWPALLAWCLAGAAVALTLGLISPRRYQAEATVVVDSNVDLVMPTAHRYDIAAYLNHQAMRLESIAYSGPVWQVVAERMIAEGYAPDRSGVRELAENVRLPRPEDGEWRFLAYDRDPSRAASLADAWSQAFVASVDDAVRQAQRDAALQRAEQEAVMERIRLQGACAGLQAAADEMADLVSRLAGQPAEAEADPAIGAMLSLAASQAGATCSELSFCDAPATTGAQQTLAGAILALRQQEVAACRASVEAVAAELASAQSERAALVSETLGLSAATEVALTRSASVPDRPTTVPGWFLLGGAVAGGLTWGLAASGRGRREATPG